MEPANGLLLAGFDRPAPSLVTLMERLSARGVAIEWGSPSGDPGETRLHAAADIADETRSWLSWARKCLESRPDARLAVVVPDLQARRAAIERALDEHLQPELELPGTRERDRAYDLAGGEPLAACGVAAAALDCLSSLAPRIDFGTFSRLLRSRYCPAGDEAQPRVRLDLALRRKGIASWPVAALAGLARRQDCAGIGATLDAMNRMLAGGTTQRPTDEWARVFGEVLSAWGWPGEGPLASDEFQAAEALRNRLAEFARLARAAPRMSLDQARVEFLAALEAPFQPERGVPSVWILDALEPPGVGFDGLWVSGLTAASWPLPARHEAFLPLSLQRRLGIPGVTAEDALEHAVATVAAWQRSAAEVVFSWPQSQDDARVEPSRVVPAAPPLELPGRFRTRAAAWQHASPLEPLPADDAPALAGIARGGARILDLQAKCPFRAFAELRLDARPLEEPTAGIDPRLRGNLLHATLELAWRELGDAARLATLGPDELAALVERCLDASMREQLPEEIGGRHRQLEWTWQRAAALHVLALDRTRDPFEVVATEETMEADLAGLSLTLRVDRVDRVEGGLVVLDYKTGRATTSQWRGSRPDAPQLPLYAILKGAEVGGVAFVRADAQGAVLRGVAREAQRLPGMETAERFALTDDKQKGFDWSEIRSRWHGWLADLSRDFQRGVARVDPKLPGTCRHCHLATLCRVSAGFETGAMEEGDDD
jgi:ATP-dependent helicase/nuclease subunit B